MRVAGINWLWWDIARDFVDDRFSDLRKISFWHIANLTRASIMVNGKIIQTEPLPSLISLRVKT